MPAAKLTLRIDEHLIEGAKEMARASGTSLSQLVGDYFRSLLQRRRNPERAEATPLTDGLAASWRGVDLDREDYRRHLDEKFR